MIFILNVISGRIVYLIFLKYKISRIKYIFLQKNCKVQSERLR